MSKNFLITGISGFVGRHFVEMKKRSGNSGILYIGDLEIIRDFVDVRDVVRTTY